MSWFDGSAEAATGSHDVRALAARLLEVRRGLLDARSELTARLARLSGELEQIGEALESVHERADAAPAPADPAPPAAPVALDEPGGAHLPDKAAESLPATADGEQIVTPPESDLEPEPAVATSLLAAEPDQVLSVVSDEPVGEPEPDVPSAGVASHAGDVAPSGPAAEEAAEVAAPDRPMERETPGQETAEPSVPSAEQPSSEEPDAAVAPLSPAQQLDQLLADEFAAYQAPAAPPPAPPPPEADRAAATVEGGAGEVAPAPDAPTRSHSSGSDNDDFFANRGN
jgi:hypothetical protein